MVSLIFTMDIGPVLGPNDRKGSVGCGVGQYPTDLPISEHSVQEQALDKVPLCGQVHPVVVVLHPHLTRELDRPFGRVLRLGGHGGEEHRQGEDGKGHRERATAKKK
eukprot:283790_1